MTSLETTFDKKRIARNTILLYVRQFLTIVVGLYTSRVVLKTLGVSDYGVYNVVGGIVTTMAFLNSAMSAASQRFISFEMGKGNIKKLNRVFCTSVNIHLFIAAIIFLAAETVGLWFVNNHLNIESNRMVAANWVYQTSIFTFILGICSVPYNACIIAHEHMRAFAYIGIFEVVLKLLIVFCLLIGNLDKLILYGLLILGVAVVIYVCYGMYCRKYFTEAHYKPSLDRPMFCEMFAFAGWSMFGNMGFSFKDSIANIIVNIFFGTAVNAARGIGLQVSSLITSFASNFTMALNPQITKQYAADNIDTSIRIVYVGSRYSFYLLMMIAIPLLVNMEYVLRLWLEYVPPFSAEFLTLGLITSLIHSMSYPVTVALQATGKIRTFQIGICIIMLSELPIIYLLMKQGYPPYVSMMPAVVSYLVALLFRINLLKRLVPKYSLREYLFDIVLRCLAVFVGCWIILKYIHSFFSDTFLTVIITTIISFFIMAMLVYGVGISSEERRYVYQLITTKIKHKIQ